MMITPFVRRMATTEQLSNGVILPLLVDVQPFPDDVLLLLMVPVIFPCWFAGKTSLFGADGSVLLSADVRWRPILFKRRTYWAPSS